MFHRAGHVAVAEIQDAYALLAPAVGVPGAALVFALALLMSGQNATLTGTLAGQIVMEGFVSLSLRPWLRRLVTRSLAIVPTVLVVAIAGDQAVGRLLIASQVVLSLQLPFAMLPLVAFVGDRRRMGAFAIARPMRVVAWGVAGLIVVLNLLLLADLAGLG
jgi:manganese transport protein